MTQFLFANDASTTIAAPISTSATAVSLASGTGSEFPNPSAGQQFSGTFNDAATGLLTEIVYVTGITGNNVTAMVRAQEGTVAQNWLAGDLFANLLTAGQMAAMVQTAVLDPAREITLSGVFVMTTSDANGAVGLKRTTSLGVSSTTLPSAAVAGQVYAIEDLNNNFNAYPVTVNYPAGMTGPGGSEQLLNNDGQCAYFRYYGSNIWSFKP